MKILGQIFATILVVITSFLVSLLLTKIVLSLSTLYGLNFIYELGFVKIFGFMYIISILFASLQAYKKEDDNDKTYSKKLLETFLHTVGKCIGILLAWGTATIIYYIIS